MRNMTAVAMRMRTVELTTATRSINWNGLTVREGQYIGLIDGDLVGAGDDREALTIEMLQKAGATEGEILTIYYGNMLGATDAQHAREKFQRAFPALEIEIHAGGQPLYDYIISVE